MPEGATETAPVQDAGQQQGTDPQGKPEQDGKAVPPWERDGVDFDPEKAWKLLQNKDRDLAAAKAKVTEFEQRDMTEQQKLADRAEKAEKALAEREQELLRHRIAGTKGVPAELLTGKDEAEMTASADRLLAFRGGSAAPAGPSYDGGDRGSAAPADDMNAVLRRQLGRR